MNRDELSRDNLSVPDEGVVSEVRKKYPDAGDASPAILESLRNGDHNAFNHIYLHYSDSLLDFLTVLLRSREDAEEITQNVFASVWEKRATIDPQKGIRRYLYRMAKFHALDHFDRRKVRSKFMQFASASGDENYLDTDDLIAGKETALLIEMAIEHMPEKRRQIFNMSREEGLSHEEIAARLGISKNTVKNHMVAAIKDLKEVVAMFVVIFLS